MPQIETPDSAELDAIRELLRSPGYALVVARIHEQIERLRGSLEVTARGKTKTGALRGGIQSLRMVLDIPEILIAEIKESL